MKCFLKPIDYKLSTNNVSSNKPLPFVRTFFMTYIILFTPYIIIGENKEKHDEQNNSCALHINKIILQNIEEIYQTAFFSLVKM